MRKASEMPEGVELSDGGDASDDGLAADDPHKALGDISLDDIEYTAPYKSKTDRYENSFAMSANGGGVDGVPDDLFGAGKAKAKKAKKPKKVEEAPEDGEKAKRSKKSKKEKKEKKEKKKKRDKADDKERGVAEVPGTDDVDFWLSNDLTAAK